MDLPNQETVVSNYPRTPETKYYSKVVMTCLRCLLISVVCGVVIMIFDLAINGLSPVGSMAKEFLWITLMCAIGTLPLVAIACRTFPITVSAAGLRAYNGFGMYSVIPWDSIQQLPTINIFIKYFRFKKPGLRLPLMVLYDIDDPEMFTNEMGRYLGENHPIVANLRSSWSLQN